MITKNPFVRQLLDFEKGQTMWIKRVDYDKYLLHYRGKLDKKYGLKIKVKQHPQDHSYMSVTCVTTYVRQPYPTDIMRVS